MHPKVIGESLPATVPSAHSGFSKGSLGLYVVIIIIRTSVCDQNHALSIRLQVVAMAKWENRALLTQG